MCGRTTHRSAADTVSGTSQAATRVTASERHPAPAAALGERHLRTSDGEREEAVNELRDHAAAGRLSTEELAARVETALAARTGGELEALFEDLPARAPRQRSPARSKRLGARLHVGAYVWASLAMIVIWVATGAGYFWPMWPILGWGIGVFSHGRACGFGPHLARGQRQGRLT